MGPFSTFISATTDYGIKRIFGQEGCEYVTANFLSDVLDTPDRIEDVKFLPQELLPGSPGERLAIVDVRCITGNGEHFIVEMQRNRQRYFKDASSHLAILLRTGTIYYSTFPIVQQAQKGDA